VRRWSNCTQILLPPRHAVAFCGLAQNQQQRRSWRVHLPCTAGLADYGWSRRFGSSAWRKPVTIGGHVWALSQTGLRCASHRKKGGRRGGKRKRKRRKKLPSKKKNGGRGNHRPGRLGRSWRRCWRGDPSGRRGPGGGRGHERFATPCDRFLLSPRKTLHAYFKEGFSSHIIYFEKTIPVCKKWCPDSEEQLARAHVAASRKRKGLCRRNERGDGPAGDGPAALRRRPQSTSPAVTPARAQPNRESNESIRFSSDNVSPILLSASRKGRQPRPRAGGSAPGPGSRRIVSTHAIGEESEARTVGEASASDPLAATFLFPPPTSLFPKRPLFPLICRCNNRDAAPTLTAPTAVRLARGGVSRGRGRRRGGSGGGGDRAVRRGGAHHQGSSRHL
jgi:hypothetical protein